MPYNKHMKKQSNIIILIVYDNISHACSTTGNMVLNILDELITKENMVHLKCNKSRA